MPSTVVGIVLIVGTFDVNKKQFYNNLVLSLNKKNCWIVKNVF